MWVELGSDENAPSVVYADTPVPDRPAEVKWRRVFNPGTGRYEWVSTFEGNPGVPHPVEPLPPSTVGGSAYEMTDAEGDALGVTSDDLPTPQIPA